jgi:hypothetical protein
MACLPHLLPPSRFSSLFPKLLSTVPLQANSLVSRRLISSSSIRLTGSNKSSVKACAVLQGGDESGGNQSEGDEDEGEEDMVPSILPERWDVLGLGQAMVLLLF